MATHISTTGLGFRYDTKFNKNNLSPLCEPSRYFVRLCVTTLSGDQKKRNTALN